MSVGGESRWSSGLRCHLLWLHPIRAAVHVQTAQFLNQLPTNAHGEVAKDDLRILVPEPKWKIQMKPLAPVFCLAQPVLCGLLGDEPVDETSLCLSVLVTLP